MTTSKVPRQNTLEKYAPIREVAGCPGLYAHQANDVFALWLAWEEESGSKQEIPFWATVWPGAVVFAQYLLSEHIRVAGKRILDFGCGGAIAGIAAARAGATEVICNDIDSVALKIAEKNAVTNQVVLKPDDTDYLNNAPFPFVDIVLVADMFYHQKQARRLMQRLSGVVLNGCQVFIADGERAFAPKKNVRELATEIVPVNRELEGVRERKVRLLELLS